MKDLTNFLSILLFGVQPENFKPFSLDLTVSVVTAFVGMCVSMFMPVSVFDVAAYLLIVRL